jgi:hypothetical protein
LHNLNPSPKKEHAMDEKLTPPYPEHQQRTCQNQFPDLDVPRDILELVEAGVLEDTSWHNDVCASFESFRGEEPGIRLWVDHSDPAQRELDRGYRFTIDRLEYRGRSTWDFRDSALLAQLAPDSEPCLVQPLPPGLKVGHHEDEGLRWDEVDRQGQPLTFTTSTALRRLRLPDDLSPWNRAVLAFLWALPPDSRIILYWC